MGHVTRLRRRRNAARPASKNAKTLMTLRGLNAKDIPGKGKITLNQVEEYLRTLEADAKVDQTQKPISNESEEGQMQVSQEEE